MSELPKDSSWVSALVIFYIKEFKTIKIIFCVAFQNLSSSVFVSPDKHYQTIFKSN